MKTSLNLFIAPAGWGKTHECLVRFCEYIRAAPDLVSFYSFYVVPTQEHAERIRGILLRDASIRAIGNAHVTTFDEFIRYLYPESQPVVTDVLKNVFIREILSDLPLTYFRDARHQPGLTELISDFLGELKESGVSVETLGRALGGLEKTGSHTKYRELARILSAYEKRLRSEGLFDVHDAGLFLKSFLSRPETPKPKLDHVFVDGFFEFTPIQKSVLDFLSRHARSVTVALTADQHGGATPRFEVAEETRSELERMGFVPAPGCFTADDTTASSRGSDAVPARGTMPRAGGGDAERRRPLTENKRAKHVDLKQLECRLFGSADGGKGEKAEAVQIFEASDARNEVEMIAREIRALYAQGNYHFSDFCLIFRRIGSYAPVIKRVFDDFEIPVHIHERSRLRAHSFVISLVSLLDIFANHWKKEDVFRFLRSGSSGASPALVSQMERYVYSEGDIEGRALWTGVWAGFPEDLEGERKKILENLTGTEDRFMKCRTANAYIGLIREYAALFSDLRLRMMEDGEGQRDLGYRYDRTLASEASAVRRLLKILDELSHSFRRRGGEDINFEEFYKVFVRTVEVSLFSEPEWGKNRVQVYNISLARQKEYKVVFLCGLLERSFPQKVYEDPILKDADRIRLVAGGKPVLKGRLGRQSIERYLFYLAVTRASERLYLTYPRFEQDGSVSSPSFYIDDVRRSFPAGVPTYTHKASDVVPFLEEVRTRPELERAITWKIFERRRAADLSADHEKNMHYLNVASLVAAREADFLTSLKDIYRSMRRFSWANRRRSRLGDEYALKLYANRDGAFSPTGLETYGACPFRYFLMSEVRLSEPEEEISARDVGIVFHKILELFFMSGGYAAPQSEAQLVLEKALRETLSKTPLKGDRRYRVEIKQMEVEELARRFLERVSEEKQYAKLMPFDHEYSFGIKDEPLDLSIGKVTEANKKVLLRGFIDRIDIDPEKKWAVVVDYKFGKVFHMREIEDGLLLQLPLYLLAVEQKLGLRPVGAYLFTLSSLKLEKPTRKGFYSKQALEAIGLKEGMTKELACMGIGPRMNEVKSENDFQGIIRQTVTWAYRYAEQIREARFPVYPKDCVRYCKFKPVCRIENWMIDRVQYERAEEK